MNSYLYTVYQLTTKDARVKDVTPIIVCLQRRINDQLDRNDPEREFFLHTLRYLTALNGSDAIAGNWMITSYEVNLEHRIGYGGLYVYLQVISSSCMSFICVL